MKRRWRKVAEQLVARGVSNTAVLRAIEKMAREEFVPDELRDLAYEDTPLPIGEGQTISQPFMVAAMTEALGLEGSKRVAELHHDPGLSGQA
ncbi:MAG: protein-L-isoaspartate O-methyltransferase family protein [Methyloligellaceae bacterium]